MPSQRLLAPDIEDIAGAGWRPDSWRTLPIEQQPDWPDLDELTAVADYMRGLPALTPVEEILALRDDMKRVGTGDAFLLQAGDCAEPLGATASASARAKHDFLALLADRLACGIARPVIGVGRLGGQFAKPRSEPVETVDGQRLPVFRGLMVNDPAPTPGARLPDPYRLLSCYYTAKQVLADLAAAGGAIRASHEVLILDYEQALTRFDETTGEWFLRSTHLPWVGDRTRQTDAAHVHFLAGIANPVAVKVGPGAAVEDVLRLCAILDPHRLPGRLTLISRMGANRVADRLPPLVAAVADAGHPVGWVCDAMHGNTVRVGAGVKTRHLDTIIAETTGFVEVLRAGGQQPAGLHLELAAADVTECVGGPTVPDEGGLRRAYHSLCDPRLNNDQAEAVVDAFIAAMRR